MIVCRFSPTRKLLLFSVVQLAILLATALPAYAHGGGGPDATNFKATVTEVSSAGEQGGTPEGISWSVLANDALLEVDNGSGTEMVVFGYSDEPYLRIGPEGVFENRNSPAAYINQERFGVVDVPSGVSATGQPDWTKVSDESTYRWHDHRIHWMSQTLPPQVAADEQSKTIKIFDWAVPFSLDSSRFEVTGTLNWIRPDSAAPWLLIGLALTSLPLLAGLTKPPGQERKRMLKRSFAMILGTLVVIDIVHSVDDVLAVPASLTDNISISVQSALFIALGAYGARWAFKAGDGAWVGILLGAFGLALGIGATHLISLTSSQIASTLPEFFTRAMVGLNVAILVPAGILAWRVHEPMVVESTITKPRPAG